MFTFRIYSAQRLPRTFRLGVAKRIEFADRKVARQGTVSIEMRIDFILPHHVELDDGRTAVFGFVEAADYEEPVHKPQGVMSIELETGIGPAGWTDL